jgi:hypothetical protein
LEDKWAIDRDDSYLYFSDMPNPIHLRRINSAGITHCEQDWSWDTSRRPPVDHDLWTVFRGQGELRTGDRAWPLLPGDCFVLEPGGVYEGTHDPNHPLLVIHIHFDPSGDFPLEFHRRLTHLGFLKEVLTRSVFSHHEGQMDAAVVWLEAALCEIQAQERLASRAGVEDGRADAIDTICRRIYENPSGAYRGKAGEGCQPFSRPLLEAVPQAQRSDTERVHPSGANRIGAGPAAIVEPQHRPDRRDPWIFGRVFLQPAVQGKGWGVAF